MTEHIYEHKHKLTKADRSAIKGHEPFALWFTGLSGSGKSTLANEVEYTLNKKYRVHTYLLDGDNVRKGLNKDLGFTAEDREENIRRISEVVKLFVDAGLVAITAFISPYRKDRNFARSLLEEGEFIEIFVKAPLEVCEERDPKGLYKKARAGEIKHFTGIDDPYEEPENPELVIETDKLSIEESVDKIIGHLVEKGYIKEV